MEVEMDYSTVFDSRDAQGRIDELDADIGNISDEEVEELAALRELREQIYEPYWNDGVGIISHDYFPEYAEEFSYDAGDLLRGSFLACFIDWEKVADHLQQDYKRVTFMGEDYWVRN
jgi:hypothetical protein